MSVPMIAITTRSSTSVKPAVAGLWDRPGALRRQVSSLMNGMLDRIELVKARPPPLIANTAEWLLRVLRHADPPSKLPYGMLKKYFPKNCNGITSPLRLALKRISESISIWQREGCATRGTAGLLFPAINSLS